MGVGRPTAPGGRPPAEPGDHGDEHEAGDHAEAQRLAGEDGGGGETDQGGEPRRGGLEDPPAGGVERGDGEGEAPQDRLVVDDRRRPEPQGRPGEDGDGEHGRRRDLEAGHRRVPRTNRRTVTFSRCAKTASTAIASIIDSVVSRPSNRSVTAITGMRSSEGNGPK